jgi:hypothetical protein
VFYKYFAYYYCYYLTFIIIIKIFVFNKNVCVYLFSVDLINKYALKALYILLTQTNFTKPFWCYSYINNHKTTIILYENILRKSILQNFNDFAL